jgi:PTS system trehalose-specific IIC component
MIVVPLLALVPTVIIAHTVLGPIGWTIGQWVSEVVYAGLTGDFRWLFGLFFGTLYSPLVITGLHHMSNAIDLQLIADFGGTNLWPMIALSNIAQGSAVMAIIFLHRGNEKEEQVSIPAAISCYLGVTEPAMFGINIKYIYPFVAAMIGSGIAGLVATTFNVMANSIGVGGIPGFLSIQTDSMAMFIVCMVIAIVVPFLLTIVFDKKQLFAPKGEVEDAPVIQTQK